MDATVLLREDHQVLKSLLDACAADDVPDDRQRRIEDFKAMLRSHTWMEEQVFYPAVMRVRSQEARDCVRAALEEHHFLDGLVAELDGLEPEDARYRGKVRTLRECLERHLAAEEGRLFEEARIHLTDERLARLGRDMAALRTSEEASGLASRTVDGGA